MLLRLSLQKRMMSSLSSSLGGGNDIMRRRRDLHEYKVPDISMEERISISNNVFKRYTMEEGDEKERRRDGRGVGIVWFRNDLRILDNEVLNKAWMKSSSLIPVYCMDPRIFSGTTHYFGFPKTGDMRAKFLMECLADLKMNLKKRGLDLLVRHGKPEDILPSIAKAFVVGTTASSRTSAVVVYAQKETCSEEINVERLVLRELMSMQKQLQQQQSSSVSGVLPIKINLELIWGGLTMYHVDDLPFSPSDLPDVYTQFRKSVESKCRVRACCKLPRSLGPSASVSMEEVGGWGTINLIPSSQQPQQQPFQGLNFIGGETAALARLYEYFWKKDLVKTYKETRNGMLGSDYSTKFSPWLASGCLSPRYVYEEVKRYEKERLANDSTYWVLFELMWRDYFRFISIKYGASIFHLGGPRKVLSKWSQDWLLFQSWRDGQTGYPLIDANMKELSATGFMSNRGRQIVCSFLVRDMGIDWRMGAEWFETCLLDYDPCSNYGNWTYGAGVGNDPRENRYFSIPKQAKTYDPEGEYVSYWLPQLKCLPREKRNFPGPYSYIKQVIPLKFDNTSSVKSNDFSSKASTSNNNSRKYRRGKNVYPN